MQLSKKTVHDELGIGTGTNEFVLKNQYNTYKSGLEKKINDADIKND